MKPWMWATLGGALSAVGIWFVASRALDKQFASGGAQLRQQLTSGGADLDRQLAAGRRELVSEVQQQVQAQVPLMTERAVRGALDSYGITPATSRELVRLAQTTNLLIDQVQRRL